MNKKLYVVLSGTASVGKTTLIKPLIPMLEETYGEPVKYITEVARSLANKGFAINKEATSSTQRLIEDEYLRLEAETEGFIRVADRSIIDRYSYTLLNGGSTTDSVKQELCDWYANNIEEYCKKYSYIFHVPLVASLKLDLDGIRSPDEEYRKRIDELQKFIIKKHKLNVFVLTGSTEERLAIIKNVMEIRNGTVIRTAPQSTTYSSET